MTTQIPASDIHAFTSININYLPRARVLGDSIKKHHPEMRFHLMLSDEIPKGFNLEDEPFDSVIQIANLAIEDQDAWIFKHDVVELCTAVKPFAFLNIMDTYNAKSVFYFDPDVVLFSRVDAMIEDLERHAAILTPHVCAPDVLPSAIVDNEISCLKHGINNLGFLAANGRGEGRALIEWWAKRLHHYCYDDIPRGLFTDQRWMDFAHVFFNDIKIEKGPEYNVATWNYTTREISGSLQDGVMVDGRPLCFHHFSGFTNGAAQMMQGRYADGIQVIDDLYAWYREACDHAGQRELADHRWAYGYYSNGEKIERSHRLLYREKSDLQNAFPKPSQCTSDTSASSSYYNWLKSNPAKLSRASNSASFWDFMTVTEQSLLGYIDRAQKPGKLTKKCAAIATRSGFLISRKVLKLFT
ncbi:MAG TPA: glycosyl transferase [Gammaproteobacteria bacterium]|jgi:hypothetical protein|nr:glycosyl transferase [Gammaproteobacteria bacterium]